MTILSSLSETIGEKLDRIIAIYRREGGVVPPPQPTIRSYPSGRIDLNLFALDYGINMSFAVENGRVSSIGDVNNDNINTSFVRYNTVSDLLNAFSFETVEEEYYNNLQSHLEQLYSTYENIGVVDLDTLSYDFVTKYIIAYSSEYGEIQHLDFMCSDPYNADNGYCNFEWINPIQDWNPSNNTVQTDSYEFQDGDSTYYEIQIIQTNINS